MSDSVSPDYTRDCGSTRGTHPRYPRCVRGIKIELCSPMVYSRRKRSRVRVRVAHVTPCPYCIDGHTTGGAKVQVPEVDDGSRPKSARGCLHALHPCFVRDGRMGAKNGPRANQADGERSIASTHAPRRRRLGVRDLPARPSRRVSTASLQSEGSAQEPPATRRRRSRDRGPDRRARGMGSRGRPWDRDPVRPPACSYRTSPECRGWPLSRSATRSSRLWEVIRRGSPR